MNHFGSVAIPVLLIGLIMYRRIRRSIGFQKYSARRMKFRIGIFAVIGVLLIATGFSHPIRYIADAAGIAIGAVLAYLAIRYSEFERSGDGNLYYNTHTGIQAAVVILFVGRLAYRLIFMYDGSTPTGSGQEFTQQFSSDPWTAAIFFILVAYYLGYYVFLLRQEKHYSLKEL
ncbi:DUF1453 family protein [Cohnella lupini]|uniref:Uncharacterized protein DUF1453 n=1 Tax=Cohnella lupini TaxID=1294267 RepID=A0A3D9I2U0_9BACL|nr:DUF1453 family protein [Cohnella lupini]RED55476.1 uncharacterized protein DUF1453 [Cohnella lupini]